MKYNISLVDLSLPLENDLNLSTMIKYHYKLPLSEINNIGDEVDIVLEDDKGKIIGWVPYKKVKNEVFNQWSKTRACFDELLNSINDAVTIVDQAGDIIFWNHKSEEMYGLSSQDVYGQSITNFFEKEAVVLMTTIKEGKGVVNKYNRPKANVHVLINTSPIIVDNQIIGGLSIERDITDVVRLNDELSSTTAYLHELESNVAQENLSPFSKIKGRSEALQSALKLAKRVANTEATVLITGESGVGKELFAEGIHKGSNRSEHPFIAINCGAIPPPLFESELFGYEQGAFTGAVKGGKKGKLDAAKGGTIFLDEIGEMPLELQVKLLRVLQERQFYRIGGNKAIPIDVKIIAATNRDLEKMIEEGSFREDLYYRLNVISISVPPLRERVEDIPELVQLFLKEFSVKYSTPIPKIDPEVMYIFLQNTWNGNIRQLRNIIERIIILGGNNEIIRTHHLPPNFVKVKRDLKVNENVTQLEKMTMLMDKEEDLESEEIKFALQKTYGNKSAAAKILNVSRATLYNKMKKYNIK
ncbi:sigma 54-interacting transcriptional regulator [Alkalihalobacillus sp. BA299]|uniref:sigma-54 interaction domain-containing protein n=1 Tax=Alkalihalobacillus sp. BA299 TaxID=2815938 RepID=UPI0027DE042A|nr:sigma 54-interacting transcriptional regulator [Alkalihalobacillus sp. BA299]